MFRVIRALLFAALCGAVVGAAAQSWPAKPVRFICSVGLGSAPDLVARLAADRLGTRLGRQVYVENMPGGAGQIATQAAARAAPDGYTFFLAGAGVIAIDRHMFKSLPYDADRDFVPVARLYDTGALALAVHPTVPAKTVAELIALAKAQPGKLSMGVDGTLSPIIGQYFTKTTGIDVVAVPYKTPGPMLQDLAEGRTHFIFVSMQALDVYRRSGRLRVVGVGTLKRFPGLEDVPTISETLPGFRAGGIGILVAPTGTTADILQRVNRELDPIVRDPDYGRRLLAFGFTSSDAGTAQSIAEVIRAEREMWDKIFKSVGIEPH
jgi:tripartite-type tricarboxylate transporter receptor subunit TctC